MKPLYDRKYGLSKNRFQYKLLDEEKLVQHLARVFLEFEVFAI